MCRAQRQWRRIDLHLHTPASSDFQESSITLLDILKKAEARGLDIIAFTDHNSVAGYAQLLREIEQLEWLEKLKRMLPDEKRRLEEYQRLRKKILVLPGFEFTATFGFHILGIFPETTPVRVIEHLLLNLNIPADKLDLGATECGATEDVLTAYQLIDEAGGIAIAAHVNSSHGVAMRGLDFGGQTKIAYTQDPHLHALEVTDLDSKSKRSTAAFFSGIKPEYPRRMHCIQSSDSHRLNRDPKNTKNLGAFDRVTEVMLPQVSFEALKQVFLGSDFSATRPFSGKAASEPYDIVKAAREVGPNIVQSFHEGHSQRGGKLRGVIADICAFANTNGGAIYVGVPADPHKPPIGVAAPKSAMDSLRKAVQKQITPPIEVTFAVHDSNKVKVLQINVPRGPDLPYAVDENKIYVRNESETVQAVRDEIVDIIRRQTIGEVEQKPIEPAKPIEPQLRADRAGRATRIGRAGHRAAQGRRRNRRQRQARGHCVSHGARSAEWQRGAQCVAQIGAQVVALRHYAVRAASGGKSRHQVGGRAGFVGRFEARGRAALRSGAALARWHTARVLRRDGRRHSRRVAEGGGTGAGRTCARDRGGQ